MLISVTYVFMLFFRIRNLRKNGHVYSQIGGQQVIRDNQIIVNQGSFNYVDPSSGTPTHVSFVAE